MYRPRVVLVDDTPEVLDYCAGILAEKYDVVGTAPDGEVALELCAKAVPDLIVLDIRMPVLDGIEVARRLRSSGCHTPIVFLSAEDLVSEAMEAGGSAFVYKRRAVPDLLIALGEVLAGRSFVSTF